MKQSTGLKLRLKGSFLLYVYTGLFKKAHSRYTCACVDVAAKAEEPSSVRATQVSLYRLTKLSKALGSNWRKLGNSLGVSEQQLEYINKRNEGENDKGKDMLDEWKRTSGDAATLEALQEALKKAEMDDLLPDVVAGTHSMVTKSKQTVRHGTMHTIPGMLAQFFIYAHVHHQILRGNNYNHLLISS